MTLAGTAGETMTFTVSTTQDEVFEGDETFTVGLTVSGTSLDVIATDTGTGTVNNDDNGATVTVDDASADEGGAMTFTVTLNEAVQGGLTVTPVFTDGTATKGVDYEENAVAMVFAGTAGETKNFTVKTTQDEIFEGDETFTVGLTVSGTSLDVIATDTGTGTVNNDDAAGTNNKDDDGDEGSDDAEGGNGDEDGDGDEQPGVVITGPSGIQYGAFDVMITFTKAVTGFDRSGVTVINGTVTVFSGSGAVYVVTIAPSGSGMVTVGVAEDVANGNTAADQFTVNVMESGIHVKPESGLVTTEAGAADTLTVALNRRPSGSVTLSVSSSDETEGVVEPESLVFTSSDWNVPQLVTVRGVADFLIDGDQSYSVNLSVSSSQDAGFAALAPVSVSATGVDLTLSDLSVVPGRLSPAYSPQVTEYDVAVPNGVGCVDVHALMAHKASPSVTVNGRTIGSDLHCGDGGTTTAGSRVIVAVGTMRIEVEAPEAVYAVNVTRAENTAPSAPALEDQTATAGSAFGYAFVAAGDPDENQRLTYAAALEGGGGLPAWLSFDSETRAFSGTPDGADVGARVVVVTATDDGVPALSSRASFTLTVVPAPIDGRPLKLALASFGRTVASDAVNVMERRFAAAGSGQAAAAELGGQRLETDGSAQGVAGLLFSVAKAAGLDANLPGSSGQPGGVSARDLAEWSGRAQPLSNRDQSDPIRFSRRSAGEVLSGSRFDLSLAQGERAGDASRWSLWGQGGASGFSGSTEDGVPLDGRVTSAYLGIDYRLDRPVTLGLALSRSAGEIDYTDGAGDPVVADLSMTGLMPYGHWSAGPNLDLWGFGSAGRGEAKLKSGADAETAATDFSLIMAAVGLRNGLAKAGAVDLVLKGDAFVVGLESDETEDLAAAEADVQRVRLALEGTADYAVSPSSLLTPRLALGGRWDGGSVENGLGAEIEGGLVYMHAVSGWGIEALGRYLLLHQEAEFEDWSASARLFFDPGSRDRGLFIALSPEWGNPNGSGNVLWDRDRSFGSAPETGGVPAGWNPQRLDMEIGYGAGSPGRLLTSYGGIRTMGDGGTHYRLGGRMEVGSALYVGLEGERREQTSGPSESAVMLRGHLYW